MEETTPPKDAIYSQFWHEEPEADNPFTAARCLCHGYDVYGDILQKASWVEYLYLLFMGERPTAAQAQLLERLAVALANPGPRDHSIQAAMNGGVVVASSAACLMSALAVGSGNLGGSHEVIKAMDYWLNCGNDLDQWKSALQNPAEEPIDIWLPLEHPAGFDAHGNSCSTIVKQTLALLADVSPKNNLLWLMQHRKTLESFADCPLALTGVVAAAFADLELLDDEKDNRTNRAPHQKAEFLYLMLRLPGAAIHAFEQRLYGPAKFPFFADGIKYGVNL